MSSTQFTRLPHSVIPVNYALELQPDMKTFTFKGRSVVDVNVSCFAGQFTVKT